MLHSVIASRYGGRDIERAVKDAVDLDPVQIQCS